MIDKKLQIAIAIAIVLIIILLVIASSQEEEAISPVKIESDYENKLKEADKLAKKQKTGLFEVNSRNGYYEADSVMINGEIVENSTVVEKREKNKEFKERILKIGEKTSETIENLERSVNLEEPNEKIVYYQAKGLTTKQFLKQQKQVVKNEEEVVVEPSLTAKEKRKQSFENSFSENVSEDGLKCVVHRTQEITSGQLVSLRVTENFNLGDVEIQKNTIVMAEVVIGKNRALLNIGAIKIGAKLFAVSMKGYSDDGGEGVPLNINNVSKEASKEMTSTVVNEAQTLLRSVGVGAVGNIASGVVRGVANATKKENEQKIRFVANQKISFIREY